MFDVEKEIERQTEELKENIEEQTEDLEREQEEEEDEQEENNLLRELTSLCCKSFSFLLLAVAWLASWQLRWLLPR